MIRRGETLYGIAREYRVNPYALARANGLRPPYPIQAGQRLVLPGSAGKAIRTANRKQRAAPVRTFGRPALSQKTSPPPSAIPRPPPATGKGFIWPVKGRVVSGFGAKAGGLRNDGINITA